MAPIERPDWGDGSGRSSGVAIVPADVGEDVQTSDSLPLPTTRSTARSGPIVRDDWGDGRTPAPRRDETGRFAADPLGHLDPELRAQWDREGGVAMNLARAQEAAMRVLGAVSDPEDLAAHFDTLPQAIQNKVLDVLRLSPSRRTTANDMLLLIEDALSPEQLGTLRAWAGQLLPEHRDAILEVLGGQR